MSLALLFALLAIAIAFDIRTRRVPNKLVLAGLTASPVIHSIALFFGALPHAGVSWWSPLAGAGAGFALMLPLYLLRAMGAGDVKLMAMVGAFIGPAAVANATLYTLLAGGLLSLAFMLGRGVATQTLANIRFMLTDLALRRSSGQSLRLPPLQTTAARLPYALAIAIGTGAALTWPLRGF